jgi:hypothetical protein
MESLDALERFVATLLRVGKTGPVGKELWGRCSRIVTDRLGEFWGEKERAAGGEIERPMMEAGLKENRQEKAAPSRGTP